MLNLADNADNGVAFAAAGAVPPLVAALASPHAGVREAAAGALRNLAAVGECARVRWVEGTWGGGAAANAVLITDAGAAPALVALLASPDDGAAEAAAGALWNLAAVGAAPGIMRAWSRPRGCRVRFVRLHE